MRPRFGAGLPLRSGFRVGRRGNRLSFPLSASVVALALVPLHQTHEVFVAAVAQAFQLDRRQRPKIGGVQVVATLHALADIPQGAFLRRPFLQSLQGGFWSAGWLWLGNMRRGAATIKQAGDALNDAFRLG